MSADVYDAEAVVIAERPLTPEELAALERDIRRQEREERQAARRATLGDVATIGVLGYAAGQGLYDPQRAAAADRKAGRRNRKNGRRGAARQVGAPVVAPSTPSTGGPSTGSGAAVAVALLLLGAVLGGRRRG